MKIRAGRCMTMSFYSKAYMTVGFQAEIPDEVKIILSQLIRKVASKDNKDIDYLQVFTLKKTYLGKTFLPMNINCFNHLKSASVAAILLLNTERDLIIPCCKNP